MINSRGDHYCYLNRVGMDGREPGFVSKLAQTILQSGQAKAPPAQWLGAIKAMTQKGVKTVEMDVSQIVAMLEASTEKSLTKDQVAGMVTGRMPTIKEVELSNPQYASYRHAGGRYKELLFVLNSARDNVEDEIEEIEQQIEDLRLDASSLAIDLSVLMDDPGLPDRMQKRLATLHDLLPVSWAYENMPHFHGAIAPEDKNVMAHARITERGSLFFIEEIQSDWAQGVGRMLRAAVRAEVSALIRGKSGASVTDDTVRELLRGETITVGGVEFTPEDPDVKAAAERGRRRGSEQYAHVPFIHNTEHWAGVVMRRMLQRAAADPEVEQVAWITEKMRNGGGFGGTQALDQFYKVILPKLVDKLIKSAGGKVEMGTVNLAGQQVEVPQFKMTPKVREALKAPMPLYSRSPVWNKPGNEADDQAVQKVLAECALMMGSARHVRLLDKLVDVATGREVAGKYVNKGIMLSLRAKDLDRAAKHEVWHFAVDNMLTEGEKARMNRCFAEHTPAARRTYQRLIDLGEFAAAQQCRDPEECAGHAFSLWASDMLDLKDVSEPRGVFENVWQAFKDMGRWIQRVVTGENLQTPESIFESLAKGALATRRDVTRPVGVELRELEVTHGESMRG